MRIIIVGTAYPYRGGLAAFNERLAKQFQDEGHEVEMITFSLQYPNFLFPGKTQYTDAPYPTHLNIKRLINAVNPFSWIKTAKYIQKQKPDKIIFCYWMSFMAPCFGYIARNSKSDSTKTIGLIHNMIPHEPTILDKLFSGYFVNAMDGFLAMAQAVVQDINKFDKHNIPKLVSPHPLYDHYGDKVNRTIAADTLGLDPAFNYIMFFGFIRHYKGLDLLIQAFADERLRQFPVKLIIAGEFYEDEKTYLELIEGMQIVNFVELRTEFIADDAIKYYFSLADMVAQPYRSATQSGVSQISYHFDTPILVTDVGGLAEIVPHNKVGYVVDVDPAKIADALVDFYANKRKEAFVENIQEEKKKYAWSQMTATINSL